MDYRDTYFQWSARQIMAAWLQERKEAEAKIDMREALIKLFRGYDPLDCIKDFNHTITLTQDQELVEVIMSIPRGYGPNAPFRIGAWNNRKAQGKKLPELPKRIIFSGPKTIVFWYDGTKTIVSCAEDEDYDPYNAFCAALAKKMFGSTSAAKAYLKKNSEYHSPKVKKKKEPEVMEYDVNCNVDTAEAEVVPVKKKERKSVYIGDCDCVEYCTEETR
jgi:hypothetical protein